jgi:nicotinamidase-related amidase
VLRHPLTLLTREVRPIVLRPGTTWLLAQDLHAPFTDVEAGALAAAAAHKVVSREFDEFTDTLNLVTPNLERVLQAARTHQFGVVYSCLGYAPNELPSPFQVATGWLWQVPDDDGGFPPAFAPLPGEPVFTKPGWGALANPALVRALQQQAVESVVIIGTMFDFGIRQTCYELADRGIGCLVISDAVVPLTLAAQAATSGNLAHGLTKLRSTAEFLDLLTVLGREGVVLI